MTSKLAEISSILSYGGTYKTGGSSTINPVGGYVGTVVIDNKYLIMPIIINNNELVIRYTTNNPTTANYDIWVKYTKS
jgi:hypothetical protein